jgi:hypothetical protein
MLEINLNSFFTNAEMMMILENADVVTDDTIILNTKEHFFELNVTDDKLSIYCCSNKDESYISKDEFLKLYNENDIENIKIISID